MADTSKDDLDLLGDDMKGFSGSQADLEGAAENLFSSPPYPQPLHFETLSLKLHKLSHPPQARLYRNQSPLFKSKSLLSPRGLPLSKTNSKQIQTLSFIGR